MPPPAPKSPLVPRFLEAWLATRQIIQAANFNRFQKAGLSASQFMTLNLIPAKHPGMPLSELARRMNLGAATVTRTVDTLEARGLLTRTPSPTDRRSVLLALTRSGKKLQNAASTEFHQHMASLFLALTAKQQTGLVEGLESLVQAALAQTDTHAAATTSRADAATPARRSARQSPQP
jgi:DNA-binding MarR family transcriptional regulator